MEESPASMAYFFQVNHTRKGSGYTMADIQALTREWQAPALPESIPQGDMPGDKICITEEHRQKAETLRSEERRVGKECRL